MSYIELKQHGKADFPFELYKVDKSHPKYEMAMHYHANAEIIVVKSGKLTITLDDKICDAKSGDVFFVNPETLHGAKPDDAKYECLVFNPLFLKTGNMTCDLFLDNLSERNILIFDKIESEVPKNILRDLFFAIQKQNKGYEFEVLGLIHRFFSVIIENELYVRQQKFSPKWEEKRNHLKTVLRFIRDNFSMEITLEDMANTIGLSKNYFSNFFKAETGKTPVEYLISYRIERATRKLLSSDLSTTQIAYDCGFSDLSYFIKTFKKEKGISPNAYRKQSRQ